MAIFKNLIDTIGNTPMVELQRMTPKPKVHIYAKLEGQNPTGSVKDRIAKYMIEKAEADGSLTKDKIILEATSGNTGISLAMIARYKGYRVKVVMPENVSHERRQLLQLYGAEIILSDGTRGTNGSIQVAQDMANADGKYFMPFQYGNDANPLAHYETTGVEILRDLPKVDVFIAGLGTGGTLMGVGRRLKEKNKQTRVIAAAPNQEDLIQGLRSLEDGFIPPILDLKMLDGRIMIDSKTAFRTSKELTDKEGIFAGISCGAVVACARQVASRMTEGNIVCLLADGGWKYLSTELWTHDYSDLAKDVKGKIWW